MTNTPTRFSTSAHEWDEEMDTPTVDLMLDLRTRIINAS